MIIKKIATWLLMARLGVFLFFFWWQSKWELGIVQSQKVSPLFVLSMVHFFKLCFLVTPMFDPWESVWEMGKDDATSVKISCFTLLWFSKQFKQIEVTSKSIYIVVGLFTSSRDNISFNREQFLKNSQAVVLVVLKCSKVYSPHLIWYVRVESISYGTYE